MSIANEKPTTEFMFNILQQKRRKSASRALTGECTGEHLWEIHNALVSVDKIEMRYISFAT